MLRLWHNPRCSKSRAALEILECAKADFEVFHYLLTPPTGSSLDILLRKLDLPIQGVLRQSEPEWRITGLIANSSEASLRRALVTYPILIQRPILESNEAAIIARPPERVLELL